MSVKRQRTDTESNGLLQQKLVRLDAIQEELKDVTSSLAELGRDVRQAINEEWEGKLKELKEQQTKAETLASRLEAQAEALRSEIAQYMPPPLKLLEKADFVSGSHGVAEFFDKQLKQPSEKRGRRLDSQDGKDDVVYEFGEHLFNDEEAPTTVFVRKCYRDQAAKIHQLMRTKEETITQRWKSVFIGGARGVGKSILGLLMALEFVDLGFGVVYEHKDFKMLLVGSTLRPEQQDDLSKEFTRKGYAHVFNNPGVYQFEVEDTRLFRGLIIRDNLIHVQDFGDGGEGGLVLNGRSRRLVLSSPPG